METVVPIWWEDAKVPLPDRLEDKLAPLVRKGQAGEDQEECARQMAVDAQREWKELVAQMGMLGSEARLWVQQEFASSILETLKDNFTPVPRFKYKASDQPPHVVQPLPGSRIPLKERYGANREPPAISRAMVLEMPLALARLRASQMAAAQQAAGPAATEAGTAARS